MKHTKIWAFTIHSEDFLIPSKSDLLENFHFLHDALTEITTNNNIRHFYSKKRSTHIFYTVDFLTALSINPSISGMNFKWGNIMKRIYPRQKFYLEIIENLKANREK